MRPAEVVRRAADYLDRHDVEAPVPTAERLLAHVLETDRAGLYRREEGLSSAEARTFGRALCRRCAGTPVQHLTGAEGFRHLVLRVRPGVFIPRPETEVLVDVALAAIDGAVAPIVVDAGTGTGAIALSLAQEHPGARVWATDLAPEAVTLARENAEGLALDVIVVEGDLVQPLPMHLRGCVDLVVSNPPYVADDEYATLPPHVKADPALALRGGVDVYARLAAQAGAWLRPGGAMAVEIGASQGPAVSAAIRAAGFADVSVHPDLAGRARVVSARWP
jgi:release factor glutamine methyltransferase